jgi:hypothetical protein
MISALCKLQSIVRLHQPMFIVDPPRPEASQISLQWFQFADTVELTALNILDQGVAPLLSVQCLTIISAKAGIPYLWE